MSSKKSRKRAHNLLKLSLSKRATPLTSVTNKREGIKSPASNFTAARTIHHCDVRASGIFFKKRTFMLDKLICFSVTRYFVIQLVALCFSLGQFFLGIFVGFQENIHSVIHKGDSFPEDFGGCDSCDGTNCSLESVESGIEVHDESPLKECDLDINLHGIEKQCSGYFNLDVPKVRLIQPIKVEQSHVLESATLSNHTDLGGGLVRISVDSLLHGEIDKYVADLKPEIGKD